MTCSCLKPEGSWQVSQFFIPLAISQNGEMTIILVWMRCCLNQEVDMSTVFSLGADVMYSGLKLGCVVLWFSVFYFSPVIQMLQWKNPKYTSEG